MSQTVITISPEKRATLKEHYQLFLVPNKSPYVAFAAKKNGVMITALAILCILLMLASLLLHLFGLPANWLVLGFAALWAFFVPDNALTLRILALMGALAVCGELVETLMVHIWGKKYGGSTLGTVVGMVGALIGAILGAPILFGLGALPGALAGAFLGSLAVELARGNVNKEALRAAWGTMLGRLGGTLVKSAIGCAMVVIATPYIWDGQI